MLFFRSASDRISPALVPIALCERSKNVRASLAIRAPAMPSPPLSPTQQKGREREVRTDEVAK